MDNWQEAEGEAITVPVYNDTLRKLKALAIQMKPFLLDEHMYEAAVNVASTANGVLPSAR